jgi:pimeloyl-ACP methyl ester carboxylesterase
MNKPADTSVISVQHHASGGLPGGVPPLILLHGAGGSRLHWPPQIRRLNGAEVYALDLPGHGDSAGRPAATISGYAESTLDWMRSVGIGQAVLVGHSMGSAIALTIALRVPRTVAGLALVGASARLRVAPEILTDSASQARFPRAVDRVTDWAFSPKAPPPLVELARRRMLESGHDAFHSDFQACDHFDVRQQLAEIKVPALVIQGEDDQLTPLFLARELAEGLPAGQLVSLPDAGHMVMLEKPEQVAELLSRFMREHFWPVEALPT